MFSIWRMFARKRNALREAEKKSEEASREHDAALDKVTSERWRAAEQSDELRELTRQIVRRLNRNHAR